MDDLVLVQRVQTLQQRVRELPHQLHAEPLELVLLDQLVQVDVQQLERDAHVVAKHEAVVHVDDVHRVVPVLRPQVLQDADLLLRLPVKPLLVPDHLQRDVLEVAMVVRFHHLPEAALADDLQHLVPVRDVVVRDIAACCCCCCCCTEEEDDEDEPAGSNDTDAALS
uniref:Uncharacterized protein n=1 Tax=Anopheles farauti TaxID=69004 RepID=A0A182QEJ1_9DIPT